jgi:prophage tail gpP-like protein/LysM repeat protein
MSKSHNVASGDTLGAISIRYYGTFSKWTKIVNANPQLSTRKKVSDGSPVIYPGDNLVIPDEDKSAVPASPVTKTIKLSEGEQDISIVVDGYKFLGFTKYELTLAYDTFDTFSFSAPLDIASKDLAETLAPFSFKNCQVYYDGELVFKGTLLTPDPELTVDAKEITLQGYPLCGVLNDCTIPLAQYPAEYNGLNIKEIAEPIADAYGIKIVFNGEPGGPFTEVAVEPTEKVLEFLVKLSKQRKLLFTNDEQGRLVFFNPKREKAFVSFEEGKSPLISIKPQFKAQEFYSHIIGFSKTESDKESEQFVFQNKYLINRGIARCQTIIVDDAENSTDLENAVLAYGGRMFADCVSYDLECEGHKNKDGKLFKKGMIVCIKAPGAMIRKDTNFIARSIKLKRTTGGKTTTINLALPGSYTGDIPEVLPWEN